jgi:galactokinase
MKIYELIKGLSEGSFDDQLKMLYGPSERSILRNRARYLSAAENFSRLYPERDDIRIFSASGRTEVGGNHTDHQHGCVLAAAVNLDIIGIVKYHDKGVIRIKSEGYMADEIKLSSFEVNEAEKGTSAALIRGIAAKFAEMGVDIGGFDAYFTSEVLSGSGLSSSAAFEVMIGTIINEGFYEGKADAVQLAKIGQFAENAYFGKASGLMDQMVCSAGGFVAVDFADPGKPVITSVDFDFEKAGYSICITDTKGSHADLTADYSAVSAEMKHVAEVMGCGYLREADEEEFYERLPQLREKCTDRELLRAAHFFAENTRAVEEAKTLADGDTERFFELVNESGSSSAELLQNLYSCSEPHAQQIPLAIMLSKRFLNGAGAVRVHGGGFAGTIQAFVPNYLTNDYAKEMERIFGGGSCYVLSVRPVGGYELSL